MCDPVGPANVGFGRVHVRDAEGALAYGFAHKEGGSNPVRPQTVKQALDEQVERASDELEKARQKRKQLFKAYPEEIGLTVAEWEQRFALHTF